MMDADKHRWRHPHTHSHTHTHTHTHTHADEAMHEHAQMDTLKWVSLKNFNILKSTSNLLLNEYFFKSYVVIIFVKLLFKESF